MKMYFQLMSMVMIIRNTTGLRPLEMNLNGTPDRIITAARNSMQRPKAQKDFTTKSDTRYTSAHTIFTLGSSLWMLESPG